MKHFCIILFLVGLVATLSTAPVPSLASESKCEVTYHPSDMAVDQFSLSEDTEQHGEPTVNDVEQTEDQSSSGNSNKVNLIRSFKYFPQPAWLSAETKQPGRSLLSPGNPTYLVIRTLRI